MYKAPAIPEPSVDQLRKIADKVNLQLTDDELSMHKGKH